MTFDLFLPSTLSFFPSDLPFFYSFPTVLASTSLVLSLTVGQVTIDKNDPSTVEALVGQTVVLPCRVSPLPSSTVLVEWRRDGIPLSTNRSVETPTTWLHVHHVTICQCQLIYTSVLCSSGITSSQMVPCWSALSRSKTRVGSCVWPLRNRRETTATFTSLSQVIQ